MPSDPPIIPDCSQLAVPGRLPLMVLSDCWLLPHSFLPLYIFEPRYRLMLKDVLRSHRMFGIGTRLNDDSNGIQPVITAGIVHSCNIHEDGTAHLVLLGAHRVRVNDFHPGEPYPSADVTPLVPDEEPLSEVKAMRDAAIDLLASPESPNVERFDDFVRMLRALPHPEAACDVMTYHFMNIPELLAISTQLTSATARYELLISVLKAARGAEAEA